MDAQRREWATSRRRRRHALAVAEPVAGETRLLLEILRDAVSLAARAHRRREADRAPTEAEAEAWAWIFAPEPFDPTIESRLPSWTFDDVMARLGRDPDGARLQLSRYVRALARRATTRVRLVQATVEGRRRFTRDYEYAPGTRQRRREPRPRAVAG